MSSSSAWVESATFKLFSDGGALTLAINSPAASSVWPLYHADTGATPEMLIAFAITADGGQDGLASWSLSIDGEVIRSGSNCGNLTNVAVLTVGAWAYADGQHTITLKARRNNPNCQEQTTSRAFEIDLDREKPIGGRLTFPVHGATYSYYAGGNPASARRQLVFAASGWQDVDDTNNSGMGTTGFKVWKAGDQNTVYAPVAEGSATYQLDSGQYECFATAKDRTGNEATAGDGTHDIVSFRVNVPPAVVVAVTDLTIAAAVQSVRCRAVDASLHTAEGQTLRYEAEIYGWTNAAWGLKFASYSGVVDAGGYAVFALTGLTYQGQMRWRVRAFDGYDYSAWSDQGVFTVATTDFTLLVSVSPAGPQEQGNEWTFTVRASDGRAISGVKVSSNLEGDLGQITKLQNNQWVAIHILDKVGAHKILATATDNYGKTKSATATLTVAAAAQPPDFSLEVSVDPSTGKQGTQFAILVAASDRRRLDDFEFAVTCPTRTFFAFFTELAGNVYRMTTTVYEAGTYSLKITGEDLDGNAGEGSGSFTVEPSDVDGGEPIEPPESPLLESIILSDLDEDVVQPQRYTNQREVKVEINWSAGTPLWMRLWETGGADTGMVAFGNPTTFTVSDGDGLKTVSCQLFNAGGSSAVQTATITLDTTPMGPFVVQPYDPDSGLVDVCNETAILYKLILPAGFDPQQYTMRLRSTGDVTGPSLDSWVQSSAGPNEVNLTQGDGMKRIVVELRDQNMNVRSAEASIELDTVPPILTKVTAYDLTQNDPIVTNDRNVLVVIETDKTAKSLCIGEDPDQFQATRYGVAATEMGIIIVPFQLTAGEGTKHIYVRVFDRAGNGSVIKSCEILLKTTAPALTSIALADTTPAGQDDSADAGYTNDRTVNVTIQVASGEADIEAIRLSEDKDFYGSEWSGSFEIDGQTITTTFQLSEGDDLKKVYAQVRDSTKENLSNAVWAMIFLDTAAPTASVVIDTPTATQAVNLLVQAEGADYMRMLSTSDATAWSAGALDTWLAFASGVSTVTLSAGDGTKTVRLQFKDKAGNLSAVVEVQTVLDSSIISAPQNLDSNLADNDVWCNKDGEHVFTWDAPANVGPSGIREYYYTTDDLVPTTTSPSTGSPSVRAFTFDPPDLSATYMIRVRAISNSGVLGAVATFRLLIDIEKPVIE